MAISRFDEATLHHAGALDEFLALSPSQLVVIGDRLGFYRELEMLGSLTVDELARVTRADERYVHDWLATQAAAGNLTYSPRTQRYSLSRQHAAAAGNLNARGTRS